VTNRPIFDLTSGEKGNFEVNEFTAYPLTINAIRARSLATIDPKSRSPDVPHEPAVFLHFVGESSLLKATLNGGVKLLGRVVNVHSNSAFAFETASAASFTFI
jgi:hypothetical protein